MTGFLAILALPAVLCGADRTPAGSDSLASVYRAASTWEVFFAGVEARRAMWEQNWAGAAVSPDVLERARTAGGPWRILAIAEDRCSDSANTLPYIAKLVEQVPTLELRIADPAVGRPWMEAHRSPDGRAATPTVLLLDEAGRIRGCWIEQPAGMQAFWLPIVARGEMTREANRKMAWYEADAGRETLQEFLEVLEAAHRGDVICPGSKAG